jgi:hypothetical protein
MRTSRGEVLIQLVPDASITGSSEVIRCEEKAGEIKPQSPEVQGRGGMQSVAIAFSSKSTQMSRK